jgi:putative endonuclease
LVIPFSAERVLRSVSSTHGWRVYIVRCADGTLYTGVAKDLAARLDAHNGGNGAKYTRGRLPVTLVYQEWAADRGTALRREGAIKRLAADDKRRLIAAAPASGA